MVQFLQSKQKALKEFFGIKKILKINEGFVHFFQKIKIWQIMGMGGGLPRKCNLKLFLTWGRVLSKINDVIKNTM